MTALSTILTGTVIPARRVPTARIAAEPTYGIIGSVVRLDARASTDPDALPLTYTWSFVSVPIGSVMRLEGFRTLDSDGGLVSFSPDKVGNYEVQLVANNGAFDSDPVTTSINIRISLVPDATGIVPDGKWIWSYLRDVWTGVDGKESFETLWSALIQIVGAELLKLYETDYNKSIRDIQELFQRRWLSYQPELALEDSDVYFYLGNQAAGTDAISNRNSFSVSRAGAPKLSGIAASRLVTVGGVATAVVRTVETSIGITPVTTVTAATDLPISSPSQSWRVPHTLSSLSKNFEELGVTVGDVLWIDVTLNGATSVASIKTQVVGVSGNSLGFVVTDEEIKAGLVPTIPSDYYRTVAASFNIPGLGKAPDGGVLFAGTALSLKNAISSEVFKRQYFNKKLTPYDAMTPVMGWTFNLHPRRIIRNRRIPVDTSLASVPGLQEYIVQPETVEKNGKVYQVRGEKEFELPGKPIALQENTDYVIDTDYAFNGNLVFKTGSAIVEGEEADFVDRSVSPGDVFIIDSPVLSATEPTEYVIQAVLGPNTLQLERPVPLYVLSEWVVARVRIRRRTGGAYLRFVPGRFTVKSPAPTRLWAENSFFDNSANIENNFGALVGLTKAQMDSISENSSYRQAVSGLMYAYTQGSAINQVLLGSQILLGLPFTERRGIIISIEDNYRLNSIGAPSLGRIVVEDLNDDGSRSNLVRIYTYPIDTFSDLAGIATNPATGVAYVAGDIVEKFQPLSRGVDITDYITDPKTAASTSSSAALQQYHSIKARINDNVFSPLEIRLVSDFLNKITPSYISVTISSLAQFEDRVTISDVLSTNKNYRMTDDVVGSFAGLNFDATSLHGAPQIFFDSSVYELRKFGRDLRTEALVGDPLSEQPFYSNDDLTHPSSANEVWEGARCIAGDYLFILSGPNVGKYEIHAISGGIGIAKNSPEYGFIPATDQQFAILRKLVQTVKSGPTATTTSGSDVVTIADSRLRTYGVRPGDWLLIGEPKKYLITEVLEGSVGVWNTLRVTPTPTSSFSGLYSIVRPSFISNVSDTTYQIFVSSGGTVINQAEHTVGLLAEPGDELVIADHAMTLVDPQRSCSGVGKLPDGTHHVTIRRISKQYRWDSFDPSTQDAVDLGLSNGSSVTCTAGQDRVNLNIQYAAWIPGDLLVFTSGSNSTVDFGYGAGALPISKVVVFTVHFFRNLPNSGSHTWKIVRRR